jgi:selenocysteine lyase/cysteine desulfurase
MFDRKSFLKNMGILGGSALLMPLIDSGLRAEIHHALDGVRNSDPLEAARNEDYWKAIRNAYDYPTDFTNLENGYYSPMPKLVLEQYLSDFRRLNQEATFYMRRKMDGERESIRTKLADFAGIDREELALLRNTTECLDVVLAGLPLQRGDEVILSNYDYGSMVEMLEQQAERYGIVLKRVEIPLLPESEDALIAPYREAITERTKAMLVTHLIHLSGQILPVKKIAAIAKAHNIYVVVDAAHSFAHVDYKINDLDGDFFGCSLHKWLCAPLGNGLLHVRKDKIADVWPLFGDRAFPKDNIRKFEHNGTQPPAARLGISHAIDFHNSIGSAQKAARLHYLKSYWTERVRDMKHVYLNTPTQAGASCAIANVGVHGKSPAELAAWLFQEHKVFTVAIDVGAIKGVRVTPHLYNTTDDLDRLVKALDLVSR